MVSRKAALPVIAGCQIQTGYIRAVKVCRSVHTIECVQLSSLSSRSETLSRALWGVRIGVLIVVSADDMMAPLPATMCARFQVLP